RVILALLTPGRRILKLKWLLRCLREKALLKNISSFMPCLRKSSNQGFMRCSWISCNLCSKSTFVIFEQVNPARQTCSKMTNVDNEQGGAYHKKSLYSLIH